MTLRLKINLLVGILLALCVALVFPLVLSGKRAAVSDEVVVANLVAAQLLRRTVMTHAAGGTEAMRVFLEGIGRVRSNDIVLYDRYGQPLYRSPSSTYKQGRDAPAWFERLIAPLPVAQSIAFSDGRIEMRSNASRAVIDAWDDMVLLVASTLGLLLGLAIVLNRLVGHTVGPFAAIVSALNRIEAGRFDTRLPALSGAEATAIGGAFNRMADKLESFIQTERRAIRAEAQLSDSRQLAQWVDHRIEAERLAIARELHDELGQSVTAMRSMALSIARRTEAVDTIASEAAQMIADESSRLYKAMHSIIPRLTPLLLDNLGLADALRDLVERAQRAHPDTRITLEGAGTDLALGADAALALFRAAQEGLTNALRHGQPSAVALTLGVAGAMAELRVSDNGQGLPSKPTLAASSRSVEVEESRAHYGLVWLDERLRTIGGSLEVVSTPGAGVELVARLPCEVSGDRRATRPSEVSGDRRAMRPSEVSGDRRAMRPSEEQP